MLISKLGLPVVILISSILIPLGFLASFFTKDIKILYFNIGIVSAIGISMIYIATLVLTGRLFAGRQQTLCVRLHITLTGVASVIYPYLLIHLLDEYGLYGTFLILSGLTCNTFVLFVLCWTNKIHLHEKDREPLQRQSSGSHAFSNVKRLMTKSFISLLIAFAISASTLNAYLGIMLDIDAWKSRADHKAFTLMVFHTGSIVSRLVSGMLKQKKGVSIFIYPIICTICACLGQLIVYFSNNHVVFLIGIAISGLAFGGIIASSLSAVVKIVDSEMVPVATGLLTTLVGVFTIGAGPFFGYIRDTSGSYRNVILTVASVRAVGTVFYILALLSRRQEKNALIRNEDSCRRTSLTGIAFGGVVASSLSAVVVTVFPEQVPVGSGLVATVMGILTICAGPVFGSIRDKSGSYGNVIVTVSCVQAAAGVFYTLGMLSRQNNNKSVVLI